MKDTWICCSMHDKSERRGIWYRKIKDQIQICAGREGDDEFISVTVGDTFTEKHLITLVRCLKIGDWMLTETETSRIVEENKDKVLSENEQYELYDKMRNPYNMPSERKRNGEN
jgi:hypothetical protein